MKMNRRNVLLGLGTIVAGGGAALGTGAFSQVETERTLSIDAAGDADAFVGFEVNDAIESSAINDDGGTLGIDLSSGFGNGDGVNLDAITKIGAGDAVDDSDSSNGNIETHAFTITNNGADEIELEASVDTGGTIELNESGEFEFDEGKPQNVLKLLVQASDDATLDTPNGVVDLLLNNQLNIPPESTREAIVEVDLSGIDTSTTNFEESNPLAENVTITANAAQSN
ncbi:hypothetical protein OB955_20055 [Halobacteria archaeon AArc-m2/3/4]|uniref:SipW-cognate class signal peptide n=1 Tax=Natronoglomus mannanivorans TaxID=2979990 RepID=A0ABT2QJ92_9EURY|nr:hypothetical protein [Halobacteria archaeon AArc-m2/3/4]